MDCEYTLCFRAFTVVEHGDALAPNTPVNSNGSFSGMEISSVSTKLSRVLRILKSLGFLKTAAAAKVQTTALGLHPFSTARSKIR